MNRISAAGRSVKDHTPEEVRPMKTSGRKFGAPHDDRNVIKPEQRACQSSTVNRAGAMRRYLDYSNMGPWHTMINVLERQVETVRRRIAETAGCDPEEIAINAVMPASRWRTRSNGIDLQRGDEVLTPIRIIRACSTLFASAKRREGIVLKTISFPVPPPSMDDLL